MLDQKNKMLPRVKLVGIAFLALAACLIASYSKSSSGRVVSSELARPIKPASSPQQPSVISTVFFTVAGLPVRIQAAAASNDKGTTGLSYVIANTGSVEINGIDLALFDFNPTGGLMTVHAWNLATKLAVGQSASFSQQLKLPATATDRLILVAEAVRGNADFTKNTATHWQADFNTLAQAASVLVAGGSAPSLQTSQRTAPIPELYGSSYCSDAFAKAFQFSKTTDGIPLNAFSCDRNVRSVVFGFNAKSLWTK